MAELVSISQITGIKHCIRRPGPPVSVIWPGGAAPRQYPMDEVETDETSNMHARLALPLTRKSIYQSLYPKNTNQVFTGQAMHRRDGVRPHVSPSSLHVITRSSLAQASVLYPGLRFGRIDSETSWRVAHGNNTEEYATKLRYKVRLHVTDPTRILPALNSAMGGRTLSIAITHTR